MHNKLDLLQRVGDFENLLLAYSACAKGKRGSIGYKKSVFNRGEHLLAISEKILTHSFKWGGYREFTVKDPKARSVMAASFYNRVVHHAIYRQIDPYLDPLMSDSVFACRSQRGNRAAVQSLIQALRRIGPDRFAIKLDISQYFASIPHKLLIDKVFSSLPDQSLWTLIERLLASHHTEGSPGVGIPIGNYTSQLFANFFLIELDKLACEKLKFPYYWLESSDLPDHAFYVRYMDDFVLIGKNRTDVFDAAMAVVNYAKKELCLNIPFTKRVPLGSDPIPFLGFVAEAKHTRPLARNLRRFDKKLRRLKKVPLSRPSMIAQVKASFQAWVNAANLELKG